MKKIITPFFICLFSAFTMNAQTALNYGVNLAGAEFGDVFPGVYDTDYTYPSNSVLDYYSGKGLKLIRLPIKWERIQPTMNTALNATELNRITAVVDYAKTKGMQVIVDMHNYCRRSINGTEKIIGANGLPTANIKDCWTRLATALKTKTNIFAYDIMNEPHDMPQANSWFTIAQQIITGIRTTDLTTTIIVSGDDWSSGERWLQSSDNLKGLVDASNKLIFQAHIYFDADASGTYAGTYDQEAAYPNVGVDRATPFITWLNTNGLKGFVGEYGIPGDDARWNVALTNLLSYLTSNCVNGTYWAGGEWWDTYNLSIEPLNGVDKPQMATVKSFLSIPLGNCPLLTSSTEIQNEAKALNVYPNPASDQLIIEGLKLNDRIQIVNVQGQVVKDFIYNSTVFSISDLNSGIYFISVNALQNTRFVKE